jgi:hypothetical protein
LIILINVIIQEALINIIILYSHALIGGSGSIPAH